MLYQIAGRMYDATFGIAPLSRFRENSPTRAVVCHTPIRQEQHLSYVPQMKDECMSSQSLVFLGKRHIIVSTMVINVEGQVDIRMCEYVQEL